MPGVPFIAGRVFSTLIEPPPGSRTMKVMADYSYLVLYLPRGTTRDVARRILTDHAEYGHWELARVALYADGSRKATLRRPIIRPDRRPMPPSTARMSLSRFSAP
jgi:hypothetical protein